MSKPRRSPSLPVALGLLVLATMLSGCGDDCRQRTGDGICLDHLNNGTAEKTR